MVSGDGKVQTNKCLFIKAGPVCDLTVCQKSIYLAEQGGRSRPGLKNWVSGWLSPSALSQLGMRVLHHPTRSVTLAGQQGGKSNGVSWSPQAPSSWRNQACFGFTSRINTLVAAHDQGQYLWPQYTEKYFVFCTLKFSHHKVGEWTSFTPEYTFKTCFSWGYQTLLQLVSHLALQKGEAAVWPSLLQLVF